MLRKFSRQKEHDIGQSLNLYKEMKRPRIRLSEDRIKWISFIIVTTLSKLPV